MKASWKLQLQRPSLTTLMGCLSNNRPSESAETQDDKAETDQPPEESVLERGCLGSSMVYFVYKFKRRGMEGGEILTVVRQVLGSMNSKEPETASALAE